MADTSAVRIDPKEVQKMLGNRSGPVIRHATEVAQKVQTTAKRLVGKNTGTLASSIVKRFMSGPGGPHIQVGVFAGPALEYALLHHEGTKPHLITGNPLLVFYWPKAGRTMFLPSVQHPGTQANEFLTNAAKANGLRVKLGR